MPGIGIGVSPLLNRGGGTDWSSYWTQQYQDLLDYLTAQSIDEPSAADKLYQAWWVKQMVNGGYWAKAEFIDMFATPENMSLINWKSPGTKNPVKIGTPSFVAYEGYKGATDSVIDTQFKPSTDCTIAGINNMCFIVGVGDSVAEDIGDFGCIDANNYSIRIISRASDGYRYYRLNSLAQGYVAASIGKAHFAASRGASDNYDMYQNLTKTNKSTASTGLCSRNIYACGLNNNNTPVPNNRTIRYVMLFSYLTEAEVQGVISITEEYLQSIGTELFF